MNQEEKNSNKCLKCDRPTHKESEYCIFHAGAEEKTEEEFKTALKEYVNKIKKEDGDYDFKRFIFVGDINFNDDLNITIFGNADFRKTTFNGCANFKGATFEAGANFTGATFNEHAFFSSAAFPTGATFTGATFKKHAYFTFTTFNGYAIFDEANFKGDVSFYLMNLLTYLSLNETKVFPGKKLSINVNNGKNNIYFQRACLENACLDLELCEDVFIDLIDTLLRNTKIKKDQIKSHILQEKEKKFSEAKEIYLFLKNNFHSIGRYDDESWAFKKEKDMERFAHYKDGRYLKGVIFSFFNFLYGYGEEPLKVLRFAAIVVLFFSFLYFNYGISVFIPETRNIQYDFFKNIWLGIGNIELLSSIIKNFPWKDYLNSLYFSLTTFATLAFGNIGPLTITSKIIAGIESFFGPFTIALFVYTFARRTGGR